MNPPRLPPALVALSPGDLGPADLRAFAEHARRALAAGLPGLLLRELQLDDGPLLALARELGALAREHGAWFGVHDRAHVALAVGADALHLGFRSLPPAAVRASIGPGMALGVSTHAGDEARGASACDYAFFGPVRATPAKAAGLAPPVPVGWAGLERHMHAHGVAHAAAAAVPAPVPAPAPWSERAPAAAQGPERGPVWAIGGMQPGDLARARACGAAGIAVLRGIFGQADPARATRAYLLAGRAGAAE